MLLIWRVTRHKGWVSLAVRSQKRENQNPMSAMIPTQWTRRIKTIRLSALSCVSVERERISLLLVHFSGNSAAAYSISRRRYVVHILSRVEEGKKKRKKTLFITENHIGRWCYSSSGSLPESMCCVASSVWRHKKNKISSKKQSEIWSEKWLFMKQSKIACVRFFPRYIPGDVSLMNEIVNLWNGEWLSRWKLRKIALI